MVLHGIALKTQAELIRREEQELSSSCVDGRIVGFSDFERNLHSVLQCVNYRVNGQF